MKNGVFDLMSESLSDANDLPKNEDEWKRRLTPEQFQVTRKKETEWPFTGEYWDCDKSGVYKCVCCGLELFESTSKFDAGCGWPSFSEPITPQNVESEEDLSYSMRRTEIHCRRCGAHLGHVFPDGPQPTGQRYCINSVSLELTEESPGESPPQS